MNDLTNFLKAFSLNEHDLTAAGVSWDELLAVALDHQSRQVGYSDVLELILKRLARISAVHSIRGRTKDPQHLQEKYLRKKAKYSDLSISNYRTKITDLIGVRALHLYKSDWMEIHDDLVREWQFVEEPVAYVRAGDDDSAYRSKGCRPEIHKDGYRSVHYSLRANVLNFDGVVEVQVRTLFEEAWSEIDHHVRYPYGSDPAVGAFLTIFNRVAGTADEMGGYVGILRARLTELHERTDTELRQRDQTIRQLEESVEHLKQTSGTDKARLLAYIEQLKTPSAAHSLGQFVGGLAAGAAVFMQMTHDAQSSSDSSIKVHPVVPNRAAPIQSPVVTSAAAPPGNNSPSTSKARSLKDRRRPSTK